MYLNFRGGKTINRVCQCTLLAGCNETLMDKEVVYNSGTIISRKCSGHLNQPIVNLKVLHNFGTFIWHRCTCNTKLLEICELRNYGTIISCKSTCTPIANPENVRMRLDISKHFEIPKGTVQSDLESFVIKVKSDIMHLSPFMGSGASYSLTFMGDPPITLSEGTLSCNEISASHSNGHFANGENRIIPNSASSSANSSNHLENGLDERRELEESSLAVRGQTHTNVLSIKPKAEVMSPSEPMEMPHWQRVHLEKDRELATICHNSGLKSKVEFSQEPTSSKATAMKDPRLTTLQNPIIIDERNDPPGAIQPIPYPNGEHALQSIKNEPNKTEASSGHNSGVFMNFLAANSLQANRNIVNKNPNESFSLTNMGMQPLESSILKSPASQDSKSPNERLPDSQLTSKDPPRCRTRIVYGQPTVIYKNRSSVKKNQGMSSGKIAAPMNLKILGKENVQNLYASDLVHPTTSFSDPSQNVSTSNISPEKNKSGNFLRVKSFASLTNFVGAANLVSFPNAHCKPTKKSPSSSS
ncbi:uncharacterized protein [Drosophila bipectinata]|uniref:uncharacterized protein n=1 Tax=Drosophila bipectinata TaxID=42026 RepID=UPI001C8A6BB4|nr:uncharacterized protein LOC108121879 [Drosophila bipectinata]